jgi:3',5'-cyclic AMP phosphodiesterase CpdA
MSAASDVRVVQITDTHLSSRLGVPPQWPALVDWLADHPADLLVNSGDIVYADPDDDADRAFARRLHDDLPGPLAFIPGNHDIGFYGEEDERPRRLAAFTATWGGDRFAVDLPGWRVVGADAYLLGAPEHDEWLSAAVDVDRPCLLFVHQPIRGDPEDEWAMPEAARQAFERAVAGGDVRAVACGHRHCSAVVAGALWGPSLTLVGDSDDAVEADPRPGFVEFLLSPDGELHRDVVRPWLAP